MYSQICEALLRKPVTVAALERVNKQLRRSAEKCVFTYEYYRSNKIMPLIQVIPFLLLDDEIKRRMELAWKLQFPSM